MRFTIFCTALLLGWLGLYNGQLALWESNNAPKHIFPYHKQTYSQTDRAALEQGIPFHSNRELTELLEDYFS